jgi:hypothetical protein
MKAVELSVSAENPAQPPETEKGICGGKMHCKDECTLSYYYPRGMLFVSWGLIANKKSEAAEQKSSLEAQVVITHAAG